MKLRVGLVGLGDQWISRHRPALMALADRFEVRAVCCEVAERSRQIAEEFGAIPLDGFRAMMELDEIDAVLALSPDWYGPCRSWRPVKRGRVSTVRLHWTFQNTKPQKFAAALKTQALPSWPSYLAVMLRQRFALKNSSQLDSAHRDCCSAMNGCRWKANQILAGEATTAR